MGIFSFFKKNKTFFSPQQMEKIVEAIRNAERQTSGEIRVFVESRNPLVNVLERAAEIFFKLKMWFILHTQCTGFKYGERINEEIMYALTFSSHFRMHSKNVLLEFIASGFRHLKYCGQSINNSLWTESLCVALSKEKYLRGNSIGNYAVALVPTKVMQVSCKLQPPNPTMSFPLLHHTTKHTQQFAIMCT